MPAQISPPRSKFSLPVIVAAIVLVLIGARSATSWIIDYEWWKELGQVSTWVAMLLYGTVPVAAVTVVAFIFLWIAHARALKAAGTGLSEYPLYAKLSTLVLIVISILLAAATVDNWTVIRYFGGRELAEAANVWRDPVFAKPLSFYFFELPFYTMLLHVVMGIALLTALLYWIPSRLWKLRHTFSLGEQGMQFTIEDLALGEALQSRFLRGAAALFLAGWAVGSFFDRYDLLFEEHAFMTGIDYVGQNILLPLNWVHVAAFLLAAVFVFAGRFKLALAMAIILPIEAILPRIVNAAYVRPNEISLQREFIGRHIEATRAAFGLEKNAKEVDFAARNERSIDVVKDKPILDNVRLWDWRAFHDTVTQIQPLRPYIFADTDVDRYVIDGSLRQVLLTPRELDINQLGDARGNWINPHFIYTHGYGLVVAEANRITPDGLPLLFVKDAPPKVLTPSLKLTRPEIYYSEIAHEPVFVNTAQPEFNYPSGSENVYTKYEGHGGFPISSLGMRIAAAVSESDYNILLTGYFTGESRMMIHRKVTERLETLAGFLKWDTDPYMVLTPEGRMVWMVDGYTTSSSHPYARSVRTESLGRINYVRNAVKATVDAYDGTVNLYIFDESDPIIQAYSRLFPKLMKPASAMPEALRAHARYPEVMFRIQAEMYLMFHMKDPQTFYNRVDVWDVARGSSGQGGKPGPMNPTYVVATVPGSNVPEFLLILPFTPRGKDNMIGLMVARCDGPHLGEVLFLQLQKQELVFGPMQIEARINQDQNISKDLTLWNQQGSQALRGQMLVLPIEDTFLYVSPIYIQAAEGRMPQLKKVAVAMGNTLIYRDTYEEAIAELAGLSPATPAAAGASQTVKAVAAATPVAAPAPGTDAARRLDAARRHLQRYRDLMSQGKWIDAGREMEALDAELKK
jgi:uncharacterized membrane protein (UPF0182 family)